MKRVSIAPDQHDVTKSQNDTGSILGDKILGRIGVMTSDDEGGSQ